MFSVTGVAVLAIYNLGNTVLCTALVPLAGLEPATLAGQRPERCVYANFTTGAFLLENSSCVYIPFINICKALGRIH